MLAKLRQADWQPHLLLPVVIVLGLLSMQTATWVTLTAAGLAMGMMLFLMASGLSLIFGLMDVLNFAHGAFITLGAYVAFSVATRLAPWLGMDTVGGTAALLLLVAIGVAIVGGLVGLGFERVFIRRTYGSHLRQVLITMGGLIIGEQLVVVLWGSQPTTLRKPALLQGSFTFGGDIAIEKYRVLAIVVGLAVFVALQLVLTRTRLGLVIRAGVEDPEMIESLGYRIRRLFVLVFAAGSMLAAIGGAMWGMYVELLNFHVGSDIGLLVFITLIISGLGSMGGCLIGAVLLGIVANYVGFLAPKIGVASDVLLMIAVLLWRPRGLFPLEAK